MPAPAVNPYLKTKIMTASPEELRLMLYDGCLKFCRLAKQAIDAQNFEKSYENLMRSQKIVLELSTSLKHEIAPDLCSKLSALYTYIYRLLVDANTQRRTEPVDEVIKLVEYERETWTLLMQQNATGSDAPAGEQANQRPANPYAQQTAISSYARSA